MLSARSRPNFYSSSLFYLKKNILPRYLDPPRRIGNIFAPRASCSAGINKSLHFAEGFLKAAAHAIFPIAVGRRAIDGKNNPVHQRTLGDRLDLGRRKHCPIGARYNVNMWTRSLYFAQELNGIPVNKGLAKIKILDGLKMRKLCHDIEHCFERQQLLGRVSIRCGICLKPVSTGHTGHFRLQYVTGSSLSSLMRRSPVTRSDVAGRS